MFRFLLISVSMLASLSSYSLSLNEALSSAYQNNKAIKNHQEEFILIAEKYPQEINSEFVPDISANISQKQSNINDRLTNAISDSRVISKNLVVRQNLFSGGSSVSKLVAINYEIQSAQSQYFLNEQNFMLESVEIYLSMIEAQESLESADAFLKVASKQYEIAVERMKLGEATKIEVAQAKAQLANAEYNKYEKMAYHDTIKSQFIGRFYVEPVSLRFPEIISSIPKDFESFKNLANAKNFMLQKSLLDQKTAKYNLNSLKGNLLPNLEFQASYGKNSVNQIDSKTNSFTTILNLNIPILPSKNSLHTKIRQEKGNLRRSVNTIEITKRALESKFVKDWDTYNSLRLMLKSADEMVIAKSMEYEGKKAAYDVGAENITNLLTAQKEYFDSKQKYVQSKKNYYKSMFDVASDISELTAEKLKLSVDYFNPDKIYSNRKLRIIGY